MSVHCGEADSTRRCAAQPLLTEPVISRAEIRHCGEVLALSVGNLYAVTWLGQRSQFGQLKRCEFITLFGRARLRGAWRPLCWLDGWVLSSLLSRHS
jgi:hypothetical protein